MKPRESRAVFNLGLAFLITFFSAAVVLCNNSIIYAKATAGSLNANISVKSKPLKEVVTLVQEQTGYKVELRSIDESFLVSGQYRNTAVEKIFTHLLKGHNISVTINTTGKLISVISLGGRIQHAKDSKKLESIPSVLPDVDSSSSDKVASDGSLDKDPLIGLSTQDVQELHAQQAREFEQQQNAPDAVAPFTGLTLTALEDMHKKQILEFNQNSK